MVRNCSPTQTLPPSEALLLASKGDSNRTGFDADPAAIGGVVAGLQLGVDGFLVNPELRGHQEHQRRRKNKSADGFLVNSELEEALSGDFEEDLFLLCAE